MLSHTALIARVERPDYELSMLEMKRFRKLQSDEAGRACLQKARLKRRGKEVSKNDSLMTQPD
jgi:hypothetical protein